MKTRFLVSIKSWMTRRAALLAVVAGMVTLPLAAQTNFITLGNNLEAHPTRILAKYKNQFTPEGSSNALQAAGSRLGSRFQQLPQLAVLDDTDTAPVGNQEARRARLVNRINDLKRTGLFEYVEPDYLVQAELVPTDQAFTNGTLWGLRNEGQSGGLAGADIAAPAAWDLTTGSTNVIVAVIDTGIRYTHRDLTNQMWRNPGESGSGKENNGLDDDGDGYVDNVFGINAITGSGNPFDDNNHGTHCAGTIGAAANDGNPHVGVAWRVRLMACKFLSAGGSGSSSDAIKCIDFAVSKGAKILNNSWGGGGYSQALYDSINNARNKGVLFVAAAGNNAGNNDQGPHYPSNYDLDNVISVAALTRNDQLANFSNYGRNSVDLGAPGQTIYSSVATSDTAYQNLNGTSMATPHVAGVAALIMSLYPAADLSELRERILLGTVPIPALAGRCTTGGRLNAFNSLTVSGSGILQVNVNPPSGSAILASSSQPVYVTVTDLFGVPNASVSGSVSNGATLTFRNDGVAPDAVASNGVYSALFAVPAATNPVTITISANAPGKVGSTNVITYNVVPPPPNDFFTNATKVPSGGGLYLANNRFATTEFGEPQHAGVSAAVGSLWWAWTPLNNTNVFVDTTGSGGDTVLAVYTGNSVSGLTTVIATNDIGLKKQAYVSFNATGGTAYRIAVSSANTNALGSLQLRVTPGGQLDTTPPQLVVNSPLSGTTVATNRIFLSGTAVDPVPNVTGVSEVLVSVNGAIANSANGTTNWTAPALLAAGLNTIAVTALDAAGNASTPTTIQVTLFPSNPPNDIFANAIALTGTSGSNIVSTVNATKEFGEPNHAGNSGGKSAWWTYTPTEDGVLTLGTTNSNFDTLLAVYTGNQVNGLTPIASNDDAYDGVSGGYSGLRAAVRANQVYRIAVDGYGGVSGTNTVLHYRFAPATIYHLTINTTGAGTTTPTSLDVASGDSVSVTALANPGSTFSFWDGAVVSVQNPVSVPVHGDSTLTAQFAPVSFTDGFESGNLTGLNWTGAGHQPWFVQNTNVAAGTFAARSGVITNSQSSSLVLAGNFHAGLGSFDLHISSEPTWDTLTFRVDGVIQQTWSGTNGWTTYAFPLAAGPHLLEWRYAKDPNNTVGADAAFLDNVNLPIVVAPNAAAPAWLTPIRLTEGGLLIQMAGQTNQLYLLQASTNLINWQTIATNVAAGGFIQVVDPASQTMPLRFYRAVVPVPLAP